MDHTYFRVIDPKTEKTLIQRRTIHAAERFAIFNASEDRPLEVRDRHGDLALTVAKRTA